MTSRRSQGATVRTHVRVEERPLARPFRLASGLLGAVRHIRVEVGQGSSCGVGEVAVCDAFGFSTDAVVRDVRGVLERATTAPAPGTPHEWLGRAIALPLPDAVLAPARLAVEMAILDLAALLAARPLPDLLHLPCRDRIPIVRTVPIGTPIPETRGPTKMKLGSPRDEEALHGLLRARPERLILDVNDHWDGDTWRRLLPLVARLSPDVLEDPTSDDRLVERIRRAVPRAHLFRDEGTASLDDVRELSRRGLGANVKLMRFGGLHPAREALDHTRAAGTPAMLGCYLEPPRAIAYAAQLAHLTDWTDLDGHFWIVGEDPVPVLELETREPGIPRLIPGPRDDRSPRTSQEV